MSGGVYTYEAPNFGLDSEQVRILSEEGRARIAAENAAKEAKRKETLEEGARHKERKGILDRLMRVLKGGRNKRDGDDVVR